MGNMAQVQAAENKNSILTMASKKSIETESVRATAQLLAMIIVVTLFVTSVPTMRWWAVALLVVCCFIMIGANYDDDKRDRIIL